MVRIKGIVKTATQVQQALQAGLTPAEVNSFKKFVRQSIKKIELICDRSNSSPSQLMNIVM